MNTTTDILRFLDGELGSEDEAELLHRLSVLPERRETLRSHIQQAEMFERDRTAINVPYTAEQKLWARLSEMMPAPPAPQAFSTAATTVALQAAKQPRVASWMTVSAVAVIGLLIGFGSGFFAAKETTSSSSAFNLASTPLTLDATLTSTNTANSEPIAGSASRVSQQRITTVSKAPLNEISAASNDLPLAVAELSENSGSPISLTQVEPQEDVLKVSKASALALNVDGGLHLRVPHEERAYTYNPLRNDFKTAKSFIQRFDVVFTEAFGHQTPNTSATKVSFPVVTNSSVSAFYQLLENENLYVGAGFGSTNMAKKSLHLSNKIGPSDYELVADVSHVQTVWYGAFAHYRLPLGGRYALTTTAGISNSSLGLILSGELGTRIDLTDQVGLALGIRISDLRYSLDGEVHSIILEQKNKPSTGLNKMNSGPQNSQNYELTAGMSFHF